MSAPHIRIVGSDESIPTPRCLGCRGMDNGGINLVFDRPVVLIMGEEASDCWHVAWGNLGDALQAYATKQAKNK